MEKLKTSTINYKVNARLRFIFRSHIKIMKLINHKRSTQHKKSHFLLPLPRSSVLWLFPLTFAKLGLRV